jgi:hypothetical protein
MIAMPVAMPRRSGNHFTKAKANAADHARADPKHPQLMRSDAPPDQFPRVVVLDPY